MKSQLNNFNNASLLSFIILLFIGCSKSSDNSYGNPPPTTASSIKIISDAQFGSILADNAGRALYFFASDAKGTSSCTSGCLSIWPVFYVAGPTLSSGLNASDFGSIQRSDGTKQTTFKGWPLYYYAGDNNAGGPYGGGSYSVNGDGIDGLWFVAKPNYTLMLTSGQLVGADGNQYKSDYTVGTGITVYITDSLGRTLYSFKPDKFKKNNYTLSDFSNDPVWPIFQVGSVQNLPSILNKADFGSIDVFGKTQLTFRGWPLYYFGQDAVRGDTKGVSFPTPGIWPIVNNATMTAPQ